MAADDQHKIGVILVVLSALVFSTVGVFTKGVSAGAWEVIFWRGFFAALFTVAYVLWRKQFVTEFMQMGWSGISVAVIDASATAAFLTAFKLTTLANVMLIYAAAPLFAAALAFVWIREKLSRKTILACIAAFCGVAIIVQGSTGGSGNIRGDLMALWMTIGMSILMVIYRRWPDTPAAGPAALSSIVLLPVCMLFSDVLTIPAHEFLILAAFGLVFALASVLLGEGMRRISAGETALLSTLETPLAPVFGWLFFAEIPALATLIGGAIILIAAVGSQISKGKNTWQVEKN